MIQWGMCIPFGQTRTGIVRQLSLIAIRQAQSGNLALRVLAVQTGGRVLGPDNDLAGQIEQCTADANAYYELTFEAPTPRGRMSITR